MKKIAALLIACLALSMAACGGTVASTPAANDTAASNAFVAVDSIEDGAKLVYWPMWTENTTQGMVIAEAAEAFTKATGVEVEINWTQGQETRDTLKSALDAGKTIDIFDERIEYVNSTWSDHLLDIQGMYDASALNGAQNATLINLAKQQGGGTLKSIPYQADSFLMMYNKSAFDAAGIATAPTTWDEFMTDCQALKDAGYIPLTTDNSYIPAFFGSMLDRVAGLETTQAIAEGDYGNEAVLATATAIEYMVKKGYIDPRAATNVWPEGQNNIADGSVAMYLNGTWLPNELYNLLGEDFRWGAFSLPNIAEGGDGVESNYVDAKCFAINKDTAYPNAAFAFIAFMTSGEWDQKMADKTLGVPMANTSLWPDDLADVKDCIDNTTQILPWAVGMDSDGSMSHTITENFSLLIDGSIDAQGFADAFAAFQKSPF